MVEEEQGRGEGGGIAIEVLILRRSVSVFGWD